MRNFSVNIENVCSRKKIKIISFDVFDTLIQRIVSPKLLYLSMENELKLSRSADGVEFARRRIEAEKYIASKKQNYNLDDIYSTPYFNESENRQFLINMEKQYEINNVITNASAKRMYDAVSGKIPIVCVSDMYFDSDTIGSMLNKNGYNNILKLYVSNECCASKRQGDIWKLVCTEQDITNNEMLHIGDAIRSDYIIPKTKNIKTVYFKKNEDLQPSENYYYNLGYGIFGPILYEFCKWIYEQKNEEKILFLSREGEFLEKCFKIIYPNEETEILYISRDAAVKGVAYMFLQQGSFGELFNIMSLGRIETVEGILKRLGLDNTEIIGLFENNGISRHKVIDNKTVSFMDVHKDKFMDILRDYDRPFESYIETKIRNKNLVVDVGWRGSMQNMLSQYLQLKHSDKKIFGLYLGVNNNFDKKGYLYDKKCKMHHQILNFSGLIEILFMPEHGSIRGYMVENEEVKPIMDKCEFSDDSMMQIKCFQEGAYSFINDASKLNTKFDKYKYVNQLITMGCRPRKTDIEKLGNIEFYDYSRIFKLVETENILRIKSFESKFIDCRWKTAFLKRNLHVNLPYSNMVILMRKISDKKMSRKDNIGEKFINKRKRALNNG
jgi:predicted HAD superfamily hydrolase